MQVDLQCGYFDSVNHDRLYNTGDLNKSISLGISSEGIDRTFSGGAFKVAASSGMTLTVDAGRGYYNDSWFYSESAKQITLDQADSVYDRIDYVVIEASDEDVVRKCMIKTLTGTPSDNPALTPPTIDTNTQLLLAEVYIYAGTTAIINDNIADKRSETYMNNESYLAVMNGFGEIEFTRVGNFVNARIISDGSGGTYTDSTGGQILINAADLPAKYRPMKNIIVPITGKSAGSIATSTFYNLIMLCNTTGRFTLEGKKTDFNSCTHIYGNFNYLAQ